YRTKDFSLDAYEMIGKLYRDAGTAMIWGNPNIYFAEGRCVGGSTVINGGICWRTPEKALKRWEWEHRIQDVSPERMDRFFTKVEERVNVAPQDKGSVGEDCERLARGAEMLGYGVTPIRRNQKHCAGTNNCAFGCPSGAKQSTLVSYIPRAIKNGARVIANTKVTEVLVEGGKAVGVVGFVRDPATKKVRARVRVRAKIVALACGAIQTPALLLSQGLANSSRQVGRNFTCHPNTKAVAIYDDDVYGWKGTIQGSQIHEFIDEGIVITTTFVPPAMLSMSLPYHGRKSLELMRHVNRMIVAGCLIEDTNVGRVAWSKATGPVMLYQINDHDTAQMIRAIALLCEMYFATGAKRVILPFLHLEEINSADEIQRLYRHKIRKSDIEMLTVHAMGTCRMGEDPRRSVVDSYGETHDVRNLFITDASVFPTPIGVNPQISIMALSTRTADHILNATERYLR
ncbi:MAG: GMC family oxidoreductase N-terminal domain-containing protein, partial [Candidatus Methylomirabilis sp.]|nr:GMC family oxidoreductase N-terminal domain-containing protein [Deltaproteobacteria bacterium]